ncbi:uncharacterized protein TNCV_3581961 [Trichonephila clavipes]|nr:uncharacterized protein TNCV_3581961 [Trichonephila clavipes]
MPTSAINDLLKKWEAVRAMVLEWHPNQADVSRVGDLYNDNAINYFRKILKKREKQSTLDFERGRIIGMMEAGWSAKRVARQLGHYDCVVSRCWDQ